MNPEKFVLGTANLGTSYGINNPQSYNRENSLNILKHAISRGITKFDTATEYGEAENLIGEITGPGNNYKIITKVPTQDSYSYEYVKKSLEASTSKLQQKKIYGLMFHDPDIHKKDNIQEISKRLLDAGAVNQIGFSAYTLDAILTAKDKYPEWTIFQVPENILDRRLYGSQELLEMARQENTFFIRSIFLQGLLLMDLDKLPSKFQSVRGVLENLNLIAREKGVNVIDICLSYASSIPWGSGIIVAAASEHQLDQILNFRNIEIELNQIKSLPNQLLDPRHWGALK